MTLGVAILVAIGGGAGAAARYLLDACITQVTGGERPWGIWAVNVTGSLALGVLVGLAVPGSVMLVIGGGFLGAYTTFSTWMYDSVRLIEQGAWRAAIWNLAGSTGAGGLAATLGLTVAAMLGTAH